MPSSCVSRFQASYLAAKLDERFFGWGIVVIFPVSSYAGLAPALTAVSSFAAL